MSKLHTNMLFSLLKQYVRYLNMKPIVHELHSTVTAYNCLLAIIIVFKPCYNNIIDRAGASSSALDKAEETTQ